MATAYGLEEPGSIPGWANIFLHMFVHPICCAISTVGSMSEVKWQLLEAMTHFRLVQVSRMVNHSDQRYCLETGVIQGRH
jgi:hypothetical protein